jgi:hypothetical protein
MRCAIWLTQCIILQASCSKFFVLHNPRYLQVLTVDNLSSSPHALFAASSAHVGQARTKIGSSPEFLALASLSFFLSSSACSFPLLSYDTSLHLPQVSSRSLDHTYLPFAHVSLLVFLPFLCIFACSSASLTSLPLRLCFSRFWFLALRFVLLSLPHLPLNPCLPASLSVLTYMSAVVISQPSLLFCAYLLMADAQTFILKATQHNSY